METLVMWMDCSKERRMQVFSPIRDWEKRWGMEDDLPPIHHPMKICDVKKF